jgi:hypothetical protein
MMPRFEGAINKSGVLAHQGWADQNSPRQFGARIFTPQGPKSEIAAMLGFRDTGTEAALQSGLADVGVQIQQRIGR